MNFRPFAAARIAFALLLMNAALAAAQSDYFTITPCRLYDSRDITGFLGLHDSDHVVLDMAACPEIDVPEATAIAINVTGVNCTGQQCTLIVRANGSTVGSEDPPVAALRLHGRTLAENFVVQLSDPGDEIRIIVDVLPISSSLHATVDVAGYFVNDASPVLDGAGAVTFTEDGGPVVVASARRAPATAVVRSKISSLKNR
jgi:hypothetical protein